MKEIFYESYYWDLDEFDTIQELIKSVDMEGFKIAFMFLTVNGGYRIIFEIQEV